MTKNKFDICIIGCGVAGTFASLRIHEKHKNAKTLIIELGRPSGKRRRFLEGYLGGFPNSDGKLFLSDTDPILEMVDGRSVKAAQKFVFNWLEMAGPIKPIDNKSPTAGLIKKIKQNNFQLLQHDHIQWKPENVHQLSKIISTATENSKNISFSFDNEVFKIYKTKDGFTISTTEGDFFCKKLLLVSGRSGWRWATQLYKDLGMEVNDDFATYGIRMECSAQYLKDFNKSYCSILNDNLTVGPFSWFGTVIPEDHADLVISTFRSNEDRWKSDKVSFSLMSKQYFKNEGVYQADRIGKLTYLLCNDRIGREKTKSLMKKESQISILPEYDWLPEAIETVSEIIPSLISRSYFHAPTIMPAAAQIRVSENLETEIEDFYVAGENAGFQGILGAAVSGTLAADNMCR